MTQNNRTGIGVAVAVLVIGGLGTLWWMQQRAAPPTAGTDAAASADGTGGTHAGGGTSTGAGAAADEPDAGTETYDAGVPVRIDAGPPLPELVLDAYKPQLRACFRGRAPDELMVMTDVTTDGTIGPGTTIAGAPGVVQALPCIRNVLSQAAISPVYRGRNTTTLVKLNE